MFGENEKLWVYWSDTIYLMNLCHERNEKKVAS
jgi:hypothetical protein